MGGGMPPPVADLGAPCESDDDCDDICLLDLPGGYCTTLCEDACPNDGQCFVLFEDDDNGYCLQTCAESSMCREGEGYVCDVDDTCYPGEPDPPICTDDHEPNQTEGEPAEGGDLGDDCAATIELSGTLDGDDEDWFRVGGVDLNGGCGIFEMIFPEDHPEMRACIFGACRDGQDPPFAGCFLELADSPSGRQGCCSDVPGILGGPRLEITCAEDVEVDYYIQITGLDMCTEWSGTVRQMQ